MRADMRRGIAYVLGVFKRQEDDMQTQTINGGLAVAATWVARDGEADVVADILARFAPQARREPGVKLFLVHRGVENPAQFLFYELFDDEAAFTAHQRTGHFK